MPFLTRILKRNNLSKGKVALYILYVLGEVTLIVVGILIALNLEESNVQELERERERKLIAEIHNEFKENKAQLTDFEENWLNNILTSAQWLDFNYPDYDKISPDSLGRIMLQFMATPTFDPSQSSVESIINTSAFEIIQNDTLRLLTLKWRDLVKDFTEDQYELKAFNQQHLEPYIIKNTSINFTPTGVEYSFNNLSHEWKTIVNLKALRVVFILRGGELDEVKEVIDKIINLTAPKTPEN